MNYTDPTGHVASWSDMSPTERAISAVSGTQSAAMRAREKQIREVAAEFDAYEKLHGIENGVLPIDEYTMADNYDAPFSSYIPPVAYTSAKDSQGNVYWTGVEEVVDQYTQLNLKPVAYFYVGATAVLITGGAAIEAAPAIYEAWVSVYGPLTIAAGTPLGQKVMDFGKGYLDYTSAPTKPAEFWGWFISLFGPDPKER